ncbi:sulfotransferase family protein [Demequina iriomotensis]|uniref:sulfotransferase family protein n=1 Tax=Demequina iriomotensis TaxID=1536641 RepID=UPI0007837E0D|nr:sulfotransferase [Demequina iriomotensis]
MVFVGGLHRSGTTLVARILAEHPDAAGLVDTGVMEDEGQFLQDVYVDDARMGTRWGRARGQTLAWSRHPLAHLTEVDARRIPDGRERLTAAWAPYWSVSGASVLVEKTPSNIMKTRFLQEIFPDARFVVVMRNPIAQGLAVRKWAPRAMQIGLNFHRAVAHWDRVHKSFEIDRPYLHKVFVVSHEELVAEPERVIRSLDDFCGLAPRTHSEIEVRDESRKYFDYWDTIGKGPRAVGRFEPLNPIQRRLSFIPRLLETFVAPVFGPRNHRVLAREFAAGIRARGYDIDDHNVFPTIAQLNP